MIAITGAGNQLGRTTIQFLARQVAAANIVAVVRDPNKIQDLLPLGIQFRVADYDDPASLEKALEGVHKLLQLSTSGMGPRGIRQEANVVQAAKQQQVQHITYTSALKASAAARFHATRQCLETERTIAASGIPYTIFRDSLYMETIPEFIGNALVSGQFYFPAGNGCVSFVSCMDIAQALSNVLLSEQHELQKYEITGSESFNFQQMASLLSEVTGKKIHYTDIPNDWMRRALSVLPLYPEEVEWYISLANSVKANEFADVEPALEHLLGSKRRTLREYFETW